MIEMETAENPQTGAWNRRHPEQDQDCDFDESAYSDADEHDCRHSERTSLWQVGTGSALIFAGVILPAIAIVVGGIYSFEGIWRLTILHPIETLIEIALVLTVPIANLLAWHSLCYKDNRHPIRTGILNGVAIIVPSITAAVAASSFVLNYPLIDSVNHQRHDLSVGLMGLLSIPALASALYLTYLLRQAKQTRDARWRTLLYSFMGVCLTLLSFVAAEARSTYIRVAETMALSDKPKEREAGLSMLRGSEPEKELKIVCADPHAAGLSGMYLPLDTDSQKRLFFAATGKPYRDTQNTNMSLMSNDYLKNHVVGEPIEGLSLHRSAIFGKVHAQTLSSTLDWTFVFKNKSYVNQEARAEIAIPEGAVISDLTLWINGEPRKGAFSATEHAGGNYNYINVQPNNPALITDLGRGRYLLQAAPVPGQGELRVQLSITQALKLDGSGNASFGMPRFIDKNFSLAGQHNIMLRSSDKLACGLDGVKSAKTDDGVQIITGNLKEEEISNSAFTVKLSEAVKFQARAIIDPFRKDGMLLAEELKSRSSNAPRHLLVVVDSSQAVAGKVDEIASALAKIPSQIDTKIMLAGDKESAEAFDKAEGLKRLKENRFGGGQDNLFALVKAAERAGESADGAVLWIHGPQPGYNNEMYIMAPYAAAPAFYEMALDDCLTDANEFFKNHKEIGPFAAVPRSGPLVDDLNSFLSKWQAGARETYIDFSLGKNSSLPLCAEKEAAREVAVLHASQQVKQLLAQNNKAQAAAIAVRYHIVTPVSGAVVFDTGIASPLGSQTASAQAPVLQGTANGTISPQADADVIMGINTAGTVRVNNLANLEALLNIIANGTEISGLLIGGLNIVFGVLGKAMIFPFKTSARARIAFGLCLIVIALAVPGSINWLVASARDANLFS